MLFYTSTHSSENIIHFTQHSSAVKYIAGDFTVYDFYIQNMSVTSGLGKVGSTSID